MSAIEYAEICDKMALPPFEFEDPPLINLGRRIEVRNSPSFPLQATATNTMFFFFLNIRFIFVFFFFKNTRRE